MASQFYAKGIGNFLLGNIDWDTDDIYAQLTKSSYSPTVDTEDYRDDVSASCATSADLTALPATVEVVYDASNDEVELNCGASMTFTSVTTDECGGVIIYKHRGGAASADELICWCEFTSPVQANGSDIQVTFDSQGVGKFSY